MSLINKMLQDLESRRATLNGDSGVPHEIRSLPPQRVAPPWATIIGGALLILLAGAVAWWYLAAGQPAVPPPPAPIPLAPLAAPVSSPADSPVAAAPATASVAPAPAAAADSQSPARPPATPPQAVATAPAAPPPAAAQVASAPVAPPVAESAPAPASRVSSPPRTKPAPAPSSPASAEKPAPRKPQEDGEAGLKVATTLGKAPSAATSAADEGARIEKKMRVSTPRERAENEYRRALGLVNQGRVQEGIAVLRGALSEDAGHAGSRLALFGLLVEQQRFEEAQALLEETLARDPAQPQMASRLARLKLARGDARGAEETLGRTAAAALDNPEYRALHAAVLQRLTFHKKAVTEYQAALRLVPQAGVWWMGLGISLEADGSLPEARDAFQRARATGALTPELAEFVEQRLKRLP